MEEKTFTLSEIERAILQCPPHRVHIDSRPRKIMKLEITKEQLEEQLGYKIQDFKLEPLYNDKTCIGLSVKVVPVQDIKEINITGIISNDLE